MAGIRMPAIRAGRCYDCEGGPLFTRKPAEEEVVLAVQRNRRVRHDKGIVTSSSVLPPLNHARLGHAFERVSLVTADADTVRRFWYEHRQLAVHRVLRHDGVTLRRRHEQLRRDRRFVGQNRRTNSNFSKTAGQVRP